VRLWLYCIVFFSYFEELFVLLSSIRFANIEEDKRKLFFSFLKYYLFFSLADEEKMTDNHMTKWTPFDKIFIIRQDLFGFFFHK